MGSARLGTEFACIGKQLDHQNLVAEILSKQMVQNNEYKQVAKVFGFCVTVLSCMNMTAISCVCVLSYLTLYGSHPC